MSCLHHWYPNEDNKLQCLYCLVLKETAVEKLTTEAEHRKEEMEGR